MTKKSYDRRALRKPRGPAGFSFVHAQSLRQLRDRGPLRPQEFDAAATGSSSAHLTVALSRMARQGLVCRQQLRQNHSVYYITAIGREALSAYDFLLRFSRVRPRTRNFGLMPRSVANGAG